MAGGSARNKYEALRDDRHDRLRRARPILIGLAVVASTVGALVSHALLEAWWLGAVAGLLPIVSLLVPTQQEFAWRKGAEGEASVGRALDNLGDDAWALHDRLIPGSRANIDHVLIGPTGVWTVDAKNYSGSIETRARDTELWVNGRNRSKLLDQALRQQAVVAAALQAAGLGSVPVRPALCFVGVEWPWPLAPRHARGVALVSPRRLRRLVDGDRLVPLSVMRQVTYELERRLLPATGGDRRMPPPPPTPSPPPPPPAPAARPAASADRDARPPDLAELRDLTVNPWKRYGKHRLYVNRRDGTAVGYIDLQTNHVSAANEHDHRIVREAAAAYLRDS